MNINILFDGLSLGAIYALIALGYTMVYGIAKMLNFAHGDIIMVGAYAVLCTLNIMGNPILSLIVAVVICTVMGILIERIAYKPLRGASPLAVLITAIGVSYFLQRSSPAPASIRSTTERARFPSPIIRPTSSSTALATQHGTSPANGFPGTSKRLKTAFTESFFALSRATFAACMPRASCPSMA